jgi:hypothetical protein
MPLFGKNDQYSDAPKNAIDDKSTSGKSQFGNTIFGVSAVEQATSPNRGIHSGWVKRTVGSGGRTGRIFYETLVAGSIIGDATAGAGNTTATANSTGTADDAKFAGH